MHCFDYRFLADSLPANILEITGIIYDLRGKGEIRKMNNIHLFQELQHTARVDSIQSSNAIEGIVTTAERVKKLINKQSEPQLPRSLGRESKRSLLQLCSNWY